MARIEFLSGARQDFDESFDWYAARSVPTARRFALAVDAALNKIAASPTHCSRLDSTHRECRVKEFPFRVVYRLVDDRVLVVAIAHASRQPDYWQRRT